MTHFLSTETECRRWRSWILINKKNSIVFVNTCQIWFKNDLLNISYVVTCRSRYLRNRLWSPTCFPWLNIRGCPTWAPRGAPNEPEPPLWSIWTFPLYIRDVRALTMKKWHTRGLAADQRIVCRLSCKGFCSDLIGFLALKDLKCWCEGRLLVSEVCYVHWNARVVTPWLLRRFGIALFTVMPGCLKNSRSPVCSWVTDLFIV